METQTSRYESIKSWVERLRSDYPGLPDSLTKEVEKENLRKLQDWRGRVGALRENYDEMDIPKELQDLPGEELVVPAVMSVEGMTDEEVEAWHRLFACVAPQMGKMAYKYWRAHSSNGQGSLRLADILDYLPIVFLYVLSSYDETRGNDHVVDFSWDSDRTRLTTWVSIEGRRHINRYLQTCAYVVGQGSNYLHRLRGKIRSFKNEQYVEDGTYPSREEIVDEISEETYYGQTVSKETLTRKISELENDQNVVSTEEPAKGKDESFTYSDMVANFSELPSQDRIDGFHYVQKKTQSAPILQEACLKILRSEEKLTIEEQYCF